MKHGSLQETIKYVSCKEALFQEHFSGSCYECRQRIIDLFVILSLIFWLDIWRHTWNITLEFSELFQTWNILTLFSLIFFHFCSSVFHELFTIHRFFELFHSHDYQQYSSPLRCRKYQHDTSCGKRRISLEFFCSFFHGWNTSKIVAPSLNLCNLQSSITWRRWWIFLVSCFLSLVSSRLCHRQAFLSHHCHFISVISRWDTDSLERETISLV
jgi:hypothetical protein